jgi:tetratricopeptide (TPR) repeat protein
MAAGAATFLDREDIRGPMFNSYDLGPDLEYRGRKVFVDTRNVEYGYAFLKRTLDAANDQELWNGLDREYHFTHALLWYAPFVPSPPLPYIRFLEHDPAWALVYLDDRTAVYLKRTAENARAIAGSEYKLVAPLDLYTGDVIARTPRARYAELEQELIRLAAADPDSIQARLVLAQLYILVYRHEDALKLIRGTITTEPRAYRPHAILAALYVRQEKWADAGREFETAIDLAGPTAVRFDYNYVAEVFEKAGDPVKAAAYRRRAH